MIVYGSNNGKTARIADVLETTLEEADISTVVKNVFKAASLSILGARLLISGLKQDLMTQLPEGEEVQHWARELAATILKDQEKQKGQSR